MARWPAGGMRTLKRPGSTSSLRLPILRKAAFLARCTYSSWTSAVQLHTYGLTLRMKSGTHTTPHRHGEYKPPVHAGGGVAGFPPVSHMGRDNIGMHSRAS